MLFPFLLWASFLFYFEGFFTACAVCLAILFHECGHLTAFFLLSEKRPRLRFNPLGITLIPRRMLSYRHEAIIAFFGPLFNLLTALFFAPFRYSFELFEALTPISLFLFAVHLLPILPLDGGRILFALCSSLFGETGMRIASFISFIALCVSLFFFLYFLLYYGIGFTPLFSVFFLFCEQEKMNFGS